MCVCVCVLATCGVWRAADPQSLHAVFGVSGRRAAVGHVTVSPPGASSPVPQPRPAWHLLFLLILSFHTPALLGQQRVGVATLLLHHCEDSRGARPWSHFPRILQCAWSGTRGQGQDGAADGECTECTQHHFN